MMPDREKIIKIVGEMFDMYKSEYEGTSYFDEIEWAENKRDALAMLKEQEAVSPLFVSGDGQFFCGACKFPLGVSGVNFCSGCGRPVKWT